MPDLEAISAQTDQIMTTLQQLTRNLDRFCPAGITAGVGTEPYPALAELEELRVRTERLQRQLKDLKSKYKLNPQVWELERKLDEALSQYYWLWQKCKDTVGFDHR